MIAELQGANRRPWEQKECDYAPNACENHKGDNIREAS